MNRPPCALEFLGLGSPQAHAILNELPLRQDIAHMSPNPECKLAHGLPGSGKSQVFKWIRSLLGEVWLLVHGVHFVMTAPLNSMADNLHGITTMHKFRRVPFQNSADYFVNARSDEESWTEVMSRLASLQWIFIAVIDTADIALTFSFY